MDRRKFLSWVGVGALATNLPIAIAACSSDTTTTPEAAAPPDSETVASAPSRDDGFKAVGKVKELDNKGFIQDKKFAAGPLLVIRNADDSLTAVNSTCTHQGCSVAWESDASQFACPCHGSTFKADGSVDQGPASKPLTIFEAKIEGEDVLVKMA